VPALQLGACCQDDEPTPHPAEDHAGLVMRRHQEAAEIVLAKLDNPNALLAENLQHLAWALDHIQATGEGLGNSANLSNQMVRVLHELGVDAGGDVWDELVQEITRDDTP
jgi:hypothetical protein